MRKVGDEMANNKCKVMLTERNNLNCLQALPGPERTAAIQKKKKKKAQQLTETSAFSCWPLSQTPWGRFFSIIFVPLYKLKDCVSFRPFQI